MSAQPENNGSATHDSDQFDSLWRLRYALAMGNAEVIEELSHFLPLLKIGNLPIQKTIEIIPVQELLFE